eukprot:TRINITY_DN68034_c9_g10_i1.p1 TRINITY_DN68034_c9_g10~~TRINITY_DN68034_c9_g10_i1.p1  ORF type:complete len:601 (+),score=25.28 TRINITY_DN68034_c9_g10_i1:51-1853(+)
MSHTTPAISNEVAHVATPATGPASGVPTCPSLAAKRLQKEWDDIVLRGGMQKIPHCISVVKRDDDIFCWTFFFGRTPPMSESQRAKGKGSIDSSNALVMEISFPRNYPFSPPHILCTDFALFVPQFVPDWSPRLTIQHLLATVMIRLEGLSFPVNHIDLSKCHPDEVSFDNLGLSATSESSSKLILLCAKPLEKNEKYFWSVDALNVVCEIDVGVTTLWEGHNLMQYIWSYLEVGVIQQILLPEGSKNSEGRKEKLNSYEYAAEEILSYQAEPFGTADTINLFYDGTNHSLTFLKNMVPQYTFHDIFACGQPAGHGASDTTRPNVSRRGRRARAAENELERERAAAAAQANNNQTQTANTTTTTSTTTPPLSPPVVGRRAPGSSSSSVSASFDEAMGGGLRRRSKENPNVNVSASTPAFTTSLTSPPAGRRREQGFSSTTTTTTSHTTTHSTAGVGYSSRSSSCSLNDPAPATTTSTKFDDGFDDTASLSSLVSSDTHTSVGYSDGSNGSNGRKFESREPPSTPIYPAVGLSTKGDTVLFSFEPPLWNQDTHKYFPRFFTPLVHTLLYVLEKKFKMSRELSTFIIQTIGTGFNKIHIPDL